MDQSYDLSRFTLAHRSDYPLALKEIQGGRKYSCWMWYIFPQLQGLGYSETSRYYAISGLGEAAAFLRDPYLGGNLLEISAALLSLETNDAYGVFGPPDDRKLQSSMTLFSLVSEEGSVFHQVLDKFFDGKKDQRTIDLLRD